MQQVEGSDMVQARRSLVGGAAAGVGLGQHPGVRAQGPAGGTVRWPGLSSARQPGWGSSPNEWGRGHAWQRSGTQPGCGGQCATATGHGSVGSPPTGHVCTAANPCCQERRRGRAVTEPGQAAPLLSLAHLHQIAVYNWIRHLFFKGHTLHPIKIHVFFRWSHLRWLVSQLLPWCAGCWHFHFPLLASSSHTRCLLDHRRITRASKEFNCQYSVCNKAAGLQDLSPDQLMNNSGYLPQANQRHDQKSA